LCRGTQFFGCNREHKEGEIRVIVKLNFRGEVEMARGSEEYNRLVE